MNYNGGNNNDPNAYKSIEQMEQEIIALQNKVERNKEYLTNVSIEQRSILASEISEDEIRINDLRRAIERRKYNYKYSFIIMLILLVIFVIVIVVELIRWN